MKLWKVASKRKYLTLTSYLIAVSLPVEGAALGGYLNGSPFEPSDCATILREKANLASRNLLNDRAYRMWHRSRVRFLARKIATTHLGELRRTALQNQLTFFREILPECEDIYHRAFRRELRRMRQRPVWQDISKRKRLMARVEERSQERAAEEIGYFVREQIEDESQTDGISDLLEFFPRREIRMDVFESAVALTGRLLEIARYMVYFAEADEWQSSIPFDRLPAEPGARAEVAAMWAVESLADTTEEGPSFSDSEFDRLYRQLNAIKERHGSNPYSLPGHSAPSERRLDSLLRQIIARAPLPEFFRQFLKVYLKFVARNRISIYSEVSDLIYPAMLHIQLVSPESRFLLSDD